MNKDSLLNVIDRAFENVPSPIKNSITECECKECQILRNQFWGKSNGELQKIIELNYSQLPLFSPAAFQYFISKYMRHSIEYPESSACEHTIFTLTPFEDSKGKKFWAEKLKILTRNQIETFILFLEFIGANFPDPRDYKLYKKDLDRGLAFWKKQIT